MKGKIRLIAVIDLAFLLLIGAVQFLDGWAFQGARAGVYIILMTAGLLVARRLSYIRSGKEALSGLRISGGGLLLTLPAVAPAVALVFGVSALTTLILTSLGAEANTVADAPIVEMLIFHALLPALLEEGLFRLLPMTLIGRRSPALCVIISTLFFAFVHCNLLTIPYALAAGAVFMAVDLAFDSVIPSLILHLVNNTMSVIFTKYCYTPTRVAFFLIPLAVCALISIVAIILLRGKYKLAFRRIFKENEAITAEELRAEVIMPSLVLIGLCTIMAFMNLFI